jgi:uncharacterized membrane protein
VRKDMSELKRPSIIVAGALSLMLTFLLCVISKKNTQEKPSDFLEMFKIFALLGMTISTIWAWLKYLKEYVAFAIEQKLREINKKPED